MNGNTFTERPVIDLTLRHSVRRMGDITIYLTWTLDDRRPAMVLLPSFANLADVTPFIVKMDGAFRWTDTVIGDPIHQERESGIAAAAMGFDPFNHGLRHRIITIIQDNIQDLLTMPALEDTGEVRAAADLKLTNLETGETVEIEGKSDV